LVLPNEKQATLGETALDLAGAWVVVNYL